MALSRKLLGAGETVVVHTRTHWKALIIPALAFLVICFAAGALMGFATPMLPPEYHGWANGGVGVVALLILVFVTVLPFLRWLTTTYTITDRRLITRRGILTQTGHDLPLVRINNVSYERSLLDRMLGCGSLTLTTAAESPLTLRDVPDVQDLHLRMNELMLAPEPERRADH